MQPAICCIGHLTRDRIITPRSTADLPGGTAFYFCRALSRMHVKVQLLTATAPADEPLAADLRSAGVDVTCLSSAHTVVFENRYGHNPDERTQRVLQTADAFPLDALRRLRAGIFHLGPLLAGDLPGEAIPLLAQKGKVSLDVQGLLRKVDGNRVVPADWAAKKELLPFVHFLKASEEEMRVLTGATDAEEGAALLAGWGAKEVMVTQGSKGSVIFCQGALYRIAAFAPRRLTDATGCGDTYAAGYLYRRSAGDGPQAAGEFAAAAATLKLEVSGPFAGTEDEVRALLQRAGRSPL